MKPPTNDIAIIIPMFNEEEIIATVLKNLKEKRPNDTIIVVDDSSTDQSYTKACAVGDLYLLHHTINLGQGAALQTGISFARKLNIPYVVTFDADGQHSVDDIEPFINVLRSGEADIVLGSRFLGNSNISPFRKYFLKLSTLFTWMMTGILLSDSHNGFRAINIAHFPDFEITQNRMAHASEIIDIIKRLKMRYKEMPCTVYYTNYSRAKGQSLMNSINIVIEYLLGKVIK